MVEYQSVIDEKDTILVKISNGDYKDVFFGIVNLNYDDKGVSYNINLPTDKQNLHKDETFMKIVDEIIFDILKKAFDTANNSYKLMLECEAFLTTILTNNHIPFDNSTSSLVNQFTSKKCIPYVKDEKLFVHNENDGLEYDLSNSAQFTKIIGIVFPSKIILQ